MMHRNRKCTAYTRELEAFGRYYRGRIRTLKKQVAALDAALEVEQERTKALLGERDVVNGESVDYPAPPQACTCSRGGTVQGTPEKPRPVHKHAAPPQDGEGTDAYPDTYIGLHEHIISLQADLDRAVAERDEAQQETAYQAERANRNDREREVIRAERDEARRYVNQLETERDFPGGPE